MECVDCQLQEVSSQPADIKNQCTEVAALCRSEDQANGSHSYCAELASVPDTSVGRSAGYLMKALQTQQLNDARLLWGDSSYYWSTDKLMQECGWKSVRQQEYHVASMLAHMILQEGGANQYTARPNY